MEKYEIELEKLNGRMNINDLRVGKVLADGCDGGLRGNNFDIDLFKMSSENKDERFTKFDTTHKEFWDKILSLSKDELKIYFDALYKYCSWIGYE